MRIIAGTIKGRQLKTPDWTGLRPTSDRLRETLFNVLAARLPGAKWLDGFAGTGAVGIEAISRGASSVTFVEHDPRAVRLIQQNLRGCGVSDRYAIVARPVAQAGSGLASGTFDIVFLDPPYDSDEVTAALDVATRVARQDGVVVLEHASRREPPERAGAWSRVRRIAAGDSALSFYRHEPEAAGTEPPGESA